jgi:outer membrane protein
MQVNVPNPGPAHTRRDRNRSGQTMKHITALALAALMGTTAAPALAQSQGDFTVGLGLGWVEPTQNSDTDAGRIDVDGNLRPTVTVEYFVADKIGIELLAAWPFEHDVNLQGAGKVAEIKHLPPVLSLQYHFTNQSPVTPFVGAGVNYTYVFDETGKGVLAGSKVDLDDSWGLALHAGVDYAIGARGALRADVRYIDIESDVKIDGTKIGSVDIDPWVFNVAYVIKF